MKIHLHTETQNEMQIIVEILLRLSAWSLHSKENETIMYSPKHIHSHTDKLTHTIQAEQ